MKQILWYIKGIGYFDLFYGYSNSFELVGYNDNDLVKGVNNKKSTINFVFYMGDTTFTWSSNKQSIVTFSTCETKYVANTSCVCHFIWLRRLLKELWMPQEKPIEIYVDNSSAIILAKNSIFHDRSKHINTRFHYLRDYIANKEVGSQVCKDTRPSCRYIHKATQIWCFLSRWETCWELLRN